MTSEVGLETIDDEVVNAKRKLEAQLGHPVETFCWVGGEPNTYNPLAFQRIGDSGYHYCFTTLVAPIVPRSDPLFLAPHRNIGRSGHRDGKIPAQWLDRSVVYSSEEADTKRVGPK